MQFIKGSTREEAERSGVIFDSDIPVKVFPVPYDRGQPDTSRLDLEYHRYYFRKDGTLYLRHPSQKVIGDLVYTLTYVFDEDAIPIQEDERDFDRLVIEKWMVGIFGNRKRSLQAIPEQHKNYLLTWFRSSGEEDISLTIGEITSLLLDPIRQEKHRNYRWLKDRKLMADRNNPIFHSWKDPNYVILWDMADKLREDRSAMAGTYDRWREATDHPYHLDEYYQPLVPKDKELDFIRWVKEEGFKKWDWDLYDLTEPEAQEVAKTRDQLIQEGFSTYEGKRLKRSDMPWLVPFRQHIGIRISSEERRINWKVWLEGQSEK